MDDPVSRDRLFKKAWMIPCKNSIKADPATGIRTYESILFVFLCLGKSFLTPPPIIDKQHSLFDYDLLFHHIIVVEVHLSRPRNKEMDRPIYIRTLPRTPVPLAEQQMVDEFWMKKQQEIEAIEYFDERDIPMTRVKKVICAEKGKMMMTFDTPSFLTKACEIFVQELSFRAWMCANSHHRNIILDSDIAEAIASIESYDFLNDVLHTHQKEHNSTPHLKSANKPHHIKLIDQPSASCQPPSDQYPTPQFIPQSAGYSPSVRIPPPLPPTNMLIRCLYP
ncbi:hypothetical protein BAE44_0018971 [Dichanthelium oligosanthes]|uniref:Core Histone H2A/H2B/H3 domain-containing protein n=1 Tax=Dichanthelium oligosanthes TaxID=888268 RepID=A0A1E5V4B7_9POAL|nr:hypothetical protein BAE44_0018971 [Dichanthelium oligosanthes]